MIKWLVDSYYKIVPHNLRPQELLYRFKCFVWHRYSTVKPQYLPHTWVDRSDLLPHVMFQILTDFIEKENPFECHIDWDYDGEHRQAKKEMLELYHWWHYVYQKAYPYGPCGDNETLKKNCHRLIEVMSYMWT